MRRVAIIGSRDYPRLPLVSALVRALPAGTVVVSGGAEGVDKTAVRAAIAAGLRYEEIPVDTVGLPEDPEERRREFGRRAFERNSRIVYSADEVVAFWTWCSKPGCTRPTQHMSHGTTNALGHAVRLGLPRRLFGPDGKEGA